MRVQELSITDASDEKKPEKGVRSKTITMIGRQLQIRDR